jgi:hypothetical protein
MDSTPGTLRFANRVRLCRVLHRPVDDILEHVGDSDAGIEVCVPCVSCAGLP